MRTDRALFLAKNNTDNEQDEKKIGFSLKNDFISVVFDLVMPQISNKAQSVIDSQISLALGELARRRRRARQGIVLNNHKWL